MKFTQRRKDAEEGAKVLVPINPLRLLPCVFAPLRENLFRVLDLTNKDGETN
jgi:hypothetical protein